MDYKNYQSEIVVRGICMPDSIIKLIITKSSPITDIDINDTSYKNNILEDATVELWDDNSNIGNISQINERLYASDFKAELNNKYYLKVSAPGMETVYSEAEIPPPPKILDLKYDGYVETGWNRFLDYHQLRISFMNPPLQENYYDIEVWVDDSFNDSLFDHLIFTSNDPVILAENYSTPERYFSLCFSDKLFNGQKYELKILLEYWHNYEIIMLVLKGSYERVL